MLAHEFESPLNLWGIRYSPIFLDGVSDEKTGFWGSHELTTGPVLLERPCDQFPYVVYVLSGPHQ